MNIATNTLETAIREYPSALQPSICLFGAEWTHEQGVSTSCQNPKLFISNCRMSHKQRIALMETEDYRPATALELLDWAKKNPDDSRTIVALGSIGKKESGALIGVCLDYEVDEDVTGRRVDVFWVGGDTREAKRDTVYLAFKK